LDRVFGSDSSATYGVLIKPRLVATIQRLPQRTIDSILPTPGTVSPCDTLKTPLGPSKTTVLPLTSRRVQPLIVVGRDSGTAVGLGEVLVRSGTRVVDRSGAELFCLAIGEFAFGVVAICAAPGNESGPCSTLATMEVA
jgi:hypothetical protein